MLRPLFTTRNKPASEEEVQKIGALTGQSFPSDYREFLKTSNGGQPKPSTFYFGDKNQPFSDDVIQCFYGIGDKSYDLARSIRCSRLNEKLVPSELIPIAGTVSGTSMYLCVEGEKIGTVYYADSEVDNLDEDLVPTYEGFYPCAHTFTEFLESLS